MAKKQRRKKKTPNSPLTLKQKAHSPLLTKSSDNKEPPSSSLTGSTISKDSPEQKHHGRVKKRGLIILAVGVMCLIGGITLSIFVFVSIQQSYSNKALNIAYIELVDAETGKTLTGDIEYEIDVYIRPKQEDIGIQVTAIVKKLDESSSGKIYHRLKWPGNISLYSDPYWGDLEFTVQGTENIASQKYTILQTSERRSDVEQFEFIWLNGLEKINFSDRHLRLSIVPDSYYALHLGSNYQVLQEAPQVESISPDARLDLVTHLYSKQPNLSFPGIVVTFTDPELRVTSQYLVLLAGILLGIAVNLLTQWLVENL